MTCRKRTLPRLPPRKTRIAYCTTAVVVAFSALTPLAQLNAADFRGREFMGRTNFSDFLTFRRGEETILTLPKFNPGIQWDELIVSWNAEMQAEHYLKIETRGVFPDHTTRYYTLALWSGP